MAQQLQAVWRPCLLSHSLGTKIKTCSFASQCPSQCVAFIRTVRLQTRVRFQDHQLSGNKSITCTVLFKINTFCLSLGSRSLFPSIPGAKLSGTGCDGTQHWASRPCSKGLRGVYPKSEMPSIILSIISVFFLLRIFQRLFWELLDLPLPDAVPKLCLKIVNNRIAGTSQSQPGTLTCGNCSPHTGSSCWWLLTLVQLT